MEANLCVYLQMQNVITAIDEIVVEKFHMGISVISLKPAYCVFSYLFFAAFEKKNLCYK